MSVSTLLRFLAAMGHLKFNKQEVLIQPRCR